MDDARNKYEYKFLTTDQLSVSKIIDLAPALTQVKLCLSSEGVVITPSSFIKCVDIYLRVVGYTRSRTDSNNEDVPFGPINAISAPVKFNYNEDIFTKDETVELYKDLINAINTYVDDSHKFPMSNVVQIVDYVPIIFKEVIIFLNDVMNRLIEEYANGNRISIVSAIAEINNDSRFCMELFFNKTLDTYQIHTESSALVPMKEDEDVAIIVNSFPSGIRDILMKEVNTSKEDVEND